MEEIELQQELNLVKLRINVQKKKGRDCSKEAESYICLIWLLLMVRFEKKVLKILTSSKIIIYGYFTRISRTLSKS